MWNIKPKVIPVIIGATGNTENHSENTSATYRQSTTSRNYTKQPHWALHTYCGKC